MTADNSVKAGESPLLPGLPLAMNRRLELEPEVFVVKPIMHLIAGQPTEIVAFLLDFNQTDSDLAERFLNWLAHYRKSRGYRRVTTRGQSAIKQLRAELCALGANRLLESGLTIAHAQDLTEKTSGRALFANAGEWSNAKKTARNALERAN